MFAVCVIIVVRGNRVGRHAVQTRTQKLRIANARRSLWVLTALIFLTIAQNNRGDALRTVFELRPAAR